MTVDPNLLKIDVITLGLRYYVICNYDRNIIFVLCKAAKFGDLIKQQMSMNKLRSLKQCVRTTVVTAQCGNVLQSIMSPF